MLATLLAGLLMGDMIYSGHEGLFCLLILALLPWDNLAREVAPLIESADEWWQARRLKLLEEKLFREHRAKSLNLVSK